MIKPKVDLSQPSTWRGAVAILTGAAAIIGYQIAPDTVEVILSIGLTVVGALGFAVPDKEEI